MTGLFRGFSYVFRGLGLLTHKGIRGFVVIPLLINILLFAGGIWLAEQQAAYWMQHLLPDWLSWLRYILWPLFVVVIFFAVFYGFTLLANLIAAPFNAMLAECIEKQLKGQPLPEFGGLATLPGIMARTFRSELGKLWYMGKWLVLILLITVIPGVNLIAPLAWLLYGAWMLAIEYVDYPMGNHELYFQDELKALKRQRGHALGFGAALTLLTAIPVVNFLVMPIGVAGATVLWVDRISKGPAA